ncbi:MAG: CAAD domain-containing protein [Pseudanabaena sp.]
MEPQETTVEAATESLVEPVEVAAKSSVLETTKPATKPVVSAPEPAKSTTEPSAEVALPQNTSQLTTEIWDKVSATWQEYFGEGKKANVTIALTVIAAIPVLIAASTLLEFLDKLPILPSVFELVGFGYSIWFVYRYLLLATTRRELINTITAWKNKVFG